MSDEDRSDALNLFYRNPRLMILVVCLILVSGLSSLYVLPRMEDPLLTERAANINTIFPGADAERVESLVTEKLEEELQEIEEIRELRSTSSSGVSTILIELRDDIYEVDSVWSRVRDRLSDVADELPDGAGEPQFTRLDIKAFALIAALVWKDDAPPNHAILRRLAEQLDELLRTLPGTEKTKVFGEPDEEIVVEVDPSRLASLGLTAAELSRQILASDTKVTAGQVRGSENNLIMELDGELDGITRIGKIPIRYSNDGRFVQLAEIADVRKDIQDPPSSVAIVAGHRAVAIGALVRTDHRIDHWSADVQQALTEFDKRLPRGIERVTVFDQNQYVELRLASLTQNLLAGAVAVLLVVLWMMGWRSALIVGSALPLSAFMVLSGLRFLQIPIHQMSVTGLIIALGLLIDNAIVMVDEVRIMLRRGLPPGVAVSQSVRHLAVPLFGSTLTTALAFGPIAVMPGPAGEFVGSIAVSVILAIFSSLLVAMTIVPALTAIGVPLVKPVKDCRETRDETASKRNLLSDGVSNDLLAALYRRSLHLVYGRPWIGVVIGVTLPIIGFVQARKLPEQFFPPADRDQVQIELDLPSGASLQETVAVAEQVRQHVTRNPMVEQVHWFVGESAPPFYYNVIQRRKNTPRYAQALLQLKSADDARQLIQELQADLDAQFPQARILVRQLEQGPPFEAPVELRIFGPDLQQLREFGDVVRLVMSETPDVIHSRAELSESMPKLKLKVDEQQARLAGLDHASIAFQLDAVLEGAVGGSVLEATEQLPIRVRVSDQDRGRLDRVASLDLIGAQDGRAADRGYSGIPLSAVADLALEPEIALIPHFRGRRMNEVKAYITAGVLPAEVLGNLQSRLDEAGFRLPPEYELEYGGEAAKRNDAIGNLMASVGVLMTLMVATLVLSFGSFRIASMVGSVAFFSVGLGLGALWVFGYPFGFMAIVGTMGLIGVAINDAIVVLAALRSDAKARDGDRHAVVNVVMRSTRHIVATSLTTMAGFTPLVLAGGGFWPPMAIAIAGGVGGATILALYYIPSIYLLVMCRGCQDVAIHSMTSRTESAANTPRDQTVSAAI